MQQVQIHIKGNFKDSGFNNFIRRIARLNDVRESITYTHNTITVNAEGRKSNLAEFIKYCFSGPPEARVEEFSIKIDNITKAT